MIKQFTRNFSLKSTLNKGDSSARWLERHVSDEYVKKSRYENYRARSAYKLVEIDQKFNIIKPGYIVIDLGASPGSWSQVAARLMKLNNEVSTLQNKGKNKQAIKNSLVIAVDILPINPIEGVVTLGNVDFTKPLNQAKIITLLNDRKVDLVMSDMAPNASGIRELDVPNILKLAESSLKFAIQVLKPGTGAYLTKLWNGNGIEEFKKKYIDDNFETSSFVRPPATRADSTEVFLLARRFIGKSK